MIWKVNTSNPGKLAEFQKYLGPTEIFQLDLAEPDADPITIVQYKASQFEEPVIVDDVSLFIGMNQATQQPGPVQFGTNIRWALEHLPAYIGHDATFLCLLGLRIQDHIHIFKGETSGVIVHPRGESFGFNKYFQPQSTRKTFGEDIPDNLNPRKIAIDHMKSNQTEKILPLLKKWNGPFQAKD